MRRASLLCLLLIGCSKNDVATLSRIGQRIAQRTDAAFNTEPNKTMIHTLPLLQPPRAVDVKDPVYAGKQAPPRLVVE